MVWPFLPPPRQPRSSQLPQPGPLPGGGSAIPWHPMPRTRWRGRSVHADQHEDWHDLIRGKLEIRPSPGRHSVIIDPPHVHTSKRTGRRYRAATGLAFAGQWDSRQGRAERLRRIDRRRAVAIEAGTCKSITRVGRFLCPLLMRLTAPTRRHRSCHDGNLREPRGLGAVHTWPKADIRKSERHDQLTWARARNVRRRCVRHEWTKAQSRIQELG